MPHFEEEVMGPVDETTGARTNSYQRGYPYLEVSGATGKQTLQQATQTDIVSALGASMG